MKHHREILMYSKTRRQYVFGFENHKPLFVDSSYYAKDFSGLSCVARLLFRLYLNLRYKENLRYQNGVRHADWEAISA